MTKRSRRKKKVGTTGGATKQRRFAPLWVRLVISAAFVLIATGISVTMEFFTSDRIVIVATALVVLFLMHILLYNRLNQLYLDWADRRAAARADRPAQPR